MNVDPTPAPEPKSEAEYLERESRMARAALSRLGGEIVESIQRTPDAAAWTERYPWASLGAAAAGGLAAGVAAGKAFRGARAPAPEPAQPAADAPPLDASTAQAATQPSGRLVAGLGTLASAALSAAAVAATQAISEIVKESIHEAMHPDQAQAAEQL